MKLFLIHRVPVKKTNFTIYVFRVYIKNYFIKKPKKLSKNLTVFSNFLKKTEKRKLVKTGFVAFDQKKRKEEKRIHIYCGLHPLIQARQPLVISPQVLTVFATQRHSIFDRHLPVTLSPFLPGGRFLRQIAGSLGRSPKLLRNSRLRCLLDGVN